MATPRKTEGRRLRGFRLSDIPLSRRLRAVDVLTKRGEGTFYDRLEIARAAQAPSDRVYWVMVSGEKWRRVMSGGARDDKLRSEGQCRLCERPASVRKLTRHRLVPGQFGGEYVPKNVVPLCWQCHVEVESPDAFSRRLLRPKLWFEETQHAKHIMGEQWFNAMYPEHGVPTLKKHQVDKLAVRPPKRKAKKPLAVEERPPGWYADHAVTSQQQRDEAWKRSATGWHTFDRKAPSE